MNQETEAAALEGALLDGGVKIPPLTDAAIAVIETELNGLADYLTVTQSVIQDPDSFDPDPYSGVIDGATASRDELLDEIMGMIPAAMGATRDRVVDGLSAADQLLDGAPLVAEPPITEAREVFMKRIGFRLESSVVDAILTKAGVL